MTALLVAIDDWVGALPLATVREVVRAVAITPLGGHSSTLLGFINVRGDLVPVVDARATLHLPRRGMRTSDRMVLVTCAGGTMAVPVDRALDVVSLEYDALPPPDSALEPPGAAPEEEARGLSPARFFGSETEIVIVSDPELLFGHVAASIRGALPGRGGITRTTAGSPG